MRMRRDSVARRPGWIAVSCVSSAAQRIQQVSSGLRLRAAGYFRSTCDCFEGYALKLCC